MTRVEIENAIDHRRDEKMAEYKLIKNKVLAGVNVNLHSIPMMFVERHAEDVCLDIGSTLEEALGVITEARSNHSNDSNDPYFISRTSELVGEGDDEEGVTELAFYIVVNKLKSDISSIPFVDKHRMLYEMAKTVVMDRIGARIYLVRDMGMQEKFFDGEIEFDAMVNTYVERYEASRRPTVTPARR